MVSLVLLAIALVAVLVGFVLGLQHWEFRRLLRSRMREDPANSPDNRVALIVPVKGPDEGLEENLRALFAQDHDNYELIFVVESECDPAYQTIRKLIGTHHEVAATIKVAGRSTESGQKVHNLLAATAQFNAGVRILAFVDADARPPKSWLRTLTYRPLRPGVAASTGYRWFVPARSTLSNLVLASINAGAAALFGRHDFNLVWGGSWAITRETFEAIRLREAWQQTLSDDLVASRQIRDHKLHIEFEPTCLCASPVDMNFPELVEFVRRQFVIGRRYATRHWLVTLLSTTIMQVGFWGNASAACLLLASGRWTGLAHAAGAALVYGIGAVRAWLRQDAARRRFPEMQRTQAPSRWFDISAGFLVGTLAWLLLLSSAMGSTINWRGNRYRILRGGEIRLLGAPDPLHQLPSKRSSKHAA